MKDLEKTISDYFFEARSKNINLGIEKINSLYTANNRLFNFIMTAADCFNEAFYTSFKNEINREKAEDIGKFIFQNIIDCMGVFYSILEKNYDLPNFTDGSYETGKLVFKLMHKKEIIDNLLSNNLLKSHPVTAEALNKLVFVSNINFTGKFFDKFDYSKDSDIYRVAKGIFEAGTKKCAITVYSMIKYLVD